MQQNTTLVFQYKYEYFWPKSEIKNKIKNITKMWPEPTEPESDVCAFMCVCVKQINFIV